MSDEQEMVINYNGPDNTETFTESGGTAIFQDPHLGRLEIDVLPAGQAERTIEELREELTTARDRISELERLVQQIS